MVEVGEVILSMVLLEVDTGNCIAFGFGVFSNMLDEAGAGMEVNR
jgi:hypothetical protein